MDKSSSLLSRSGQRPTGQTDNILWYVQNTEETAGESQGEANTDVSWKKLIMSRMSLRRSAEVCQAGPPRPGGQWQAWKQDDTFHIVTSCTDMFIRICLLSRLQTDSHHTTGRP